MEDEEVSRGRELLESGGKERLGEFMVVVRGRGLEQEKERGFEEDLKRVNKVVSQCLG